MSGNLSFVPRWGGRFVGAHPDLMEQSPPGDRDQIVADALHLCLVAGGSGVVWGVSWSMFGGSALIGVPVGVFFALLIGLIDRAAGNEVALAGILRRPGLRRDNEHWLRLAIRLFITLVFDYTTSTLLLMAIFHIAITREVEHDRFAQNQQIIAYYDGQETARRKELLAPLLADADRQRAAVADASRALDAARLERANAQNQKQRADTEMDCELRGQRGGCPGYARGAGAKYFAAKKNSQDAATAVAKAEAQIAIYEARQAEANARLDTANADLRAGEERIRPDIAKLEEQKQAHMIPADYDVLMGYMALQRIYAGSEGSAAVFFGRVVFMTLITIGISFVVVRLIFPQASIYTALLIKRTKIMAERISADYEAESHEIRTGLDAKIGPRPPRPRLRVIGDGAWQ